MMTSGHDTFQVYTTEMKKEKIAKRKTNYTALVCKRERATAHTIALPGRTKEIKQLKAIEFHMIVLCVSVCLFHVQNAMCIELYLIFFLLFACKHVNIQRKMLLGIESKEI